MKELLKRLGLKKSESIDIHVNSEGVFITPKKDSFGKKRISKVCTALSEMLNISTDLVHYTENEVRVLEKAMQVDLYTEDGDYFGDVDWDISKEDEKKEKKFWEASEIAGNYFIRIRDEFITPLDDTCEARSLFGEYERDYFAPMFVFCNKMSFDTYAEALEKAHEMYNFVHGKE